MKQKKGIQLNQAVGAILALILIAVLVIVGIYMFANLQTGLPTTTYSIVNESGHINGTTYTLANSTVACGYNTPVISSIVNTTDGVNIASGNWTLTNSTLVNATARNWHGVSITYSYQYGGPACEAAATTVTNWSNYPALVGLVGTIVFLGIVIGVLVASFVFGGRKSP